MSFPEPVHEDKVRGKPEKFAEHYNQARLFFDSQSAVEQRHIINAFRFELSKVTVPAIRRRMLAGLVNVSEQLAAGVADGLGMSVPEPLPLAVAQPVDAEITTSAMLSLTARPGDGGIRTRKVAILVANGAHDASLALVRDRLRREGAVPRTVGSRIGSFLAASGQVIEAEASLENAPSVLFDAVVLPDGEDAISALLRDGRSREFLRDAYRHGKTILALGASRRLLDRSGISATLPDDERDPGVLVVDADATANVLDAFVEAVARHKHVERDLDPPLL
jgi:catalase